MAPKRRQRTSAILQTVLILTAIYVGVPLYSHFFPSEENVATTNDAETQLTAKTTIPALLKLSHVGSALNVAYLTIRHILRATFYLPVVVAFPTKHAYFVIARVAKAVARIVYPVVAPLIFGLRFVATFILIPFVAIQRTISILYPLYIFFGTACICGLAVGLAGRYTNSLVLTKVFGIGTSRYSEENTSSQDLDEKTRSIREHPRPGRRRLYG